MENSVDYTNFVTAAYLIAGGVLLGFALFSLIKFWQGSRKLNNLQKQKERS